jgi:hypothetical protein
VLIHRPQAIFDVNALTVCADENRGHSVVLFTVFKPLPGAASQKRWTVQLDNLIAVSFSATAGIPGFLPLVGS